MTSLRANVKVTQEIDSEGKKINVVKPDSPNKYPSTCIAPFDIRTTPETHGIVFEKIKKLGENDRVLIDLLFPEAPAGFTEPSDKIVQIARKTKGERKLTISLASADVGFLTPKGIKSIIRGLGEKRQQHKANEYCYPEKIPQAVEIYQAIVEAWAE